MTIKSVGRMTSAHEASRALERVLIQRKNSINSAGSSGLANMRGLTYSYQSHAKSTCASGGRC